MVFLHHLTPPATPCHCWLKAHAEIGLTTPWGYKRCRHCNVSGTYVAERCHYYYGYFLTERRHYYYGNFRYRFQNPAEDRTLVVNRRNGRRADKASSVAERKWITRDSGVTGECIFYRFTELWLWSYQRPHNRCVMHAVALNLVKTELENHLFLRLLLWRHAIMVWRTLRLVGLYWECWVFTAHAWWYFTSFYLDNYWCYLYERQVRYYKRQMTNNKSLCKTYTDRAQ